MRTESLPLPLTEDLPKERFVRRLFDRLSPRYDRFNRISSFGLDRIWRRRTVESLRLLPGMRVLDLASGTGDLSVEAAHRLLPLGLVAACDLSFPMLQTARNKFTRFPAARWHVQLVQGKAETLPFSDQAFDAATMGFALRNVSDLEATFREFYRVMKSGGRLCLLEFGRPRHRALRFGHQLWLATGVPLIGLLTTRVLWPFVYLRRSIFRFLAPEEVIQHLKAVGFTEIHAEPLTGEIVYLYHAAKGF